MSRTHATSNTGGGPTKYPEVDVAHMRYCREVKGMTFANIALEFEGLYTDNYIRQVCSYTIRPFIKPRNRDDDKMSNK